MNSHSWHSIATVWHQPITNDFYQGDDIVALICRACNINATHDKMQSKSMERIVNPKNKKKNKNINSMSYVNHYANCCECLNRYLMNSFIIHEALLFTQNCALIWKVSDSIGFWNELYIPPFPSLHTSSENYRKNNMWRNKTNELTAYHTLFTRSTRAPQRAVTSC